MIPEVATLSETERIAVLNKARYIHSISVDSPGERS